MFFNAGATVTGECLPTVERIAQPRRKRYGGKCATRRTDDGLLKRGASSDHTDPDSRLGLAFWPTLVFQRFAGILGNRWTWLFVVPGCWSGLFLEDKKASRRRTENAQTYSTLLANATPESFRHRAAFHTSDHEQRRAPKSLTICCK